MIATSHTWKLIFFFICFVSTSLVRICINTTIAFHNATRAFPIVIVVCLIINMKRIIYILVIFVLVFPMLE